MTQLYTSITVKMFHNIFPECNYHRAGVSVRMDRTQCVVATREGNTCRAQQFGTKSQASAAYRQIKKELQA